jgi:Ca2+-binding RTX toxin-like protein
MRRIRLAVSALAVVAASLALAGPTQAAIAPGDILIVNYQLGGAALPGVVKVDPQTGKQALVSSNAQAVNVGSSELFAAPWDLVLTPEGKLIVSDSDSLIAVNPATGKQSLVSSNGQPVNTSSQYLSFPTGIVRLPDGDFAVGSSSLPIGVVGVDAGTGKQSIISSNDQPVNVGSAFYSSVYDLTTGVGGSLVVADSGAFGQGGLIAVDPATGKQTKLSANDQAINAGSQLFGTGPSSVQLHRGTFYVTDPYADGGVGGVIGVDPATGKQRLISSNAQPINTGSAYFDNPYGVAVEPGGRIIVSSETGFSDGAGGLIAVNPLTGKQSILATNVNPPNVGSSELINYPDGVLVVPPKCGGLYPTMVGTNAKDTIVGTRYPDIIAGLGGKDKLKGLGGNDKLCGGGGSDKLLGGKGKDLLVGGKGRDRLLGGPGRDRLRGGPGRDRQRQ